MEENDEIEQGFSSFLVPRRSSRSLASRSESVTSTERDIVISELTNLRRRFFILEDPFFDSSPKKKKKKRGSDVSIDRFVVVEGFDVVV